MIKHEPDQQEIYRDSNGENRKRSIHLGDMQPKEYIQQSHMEQKIRKMSAAKAKSLSPGHLFMERKPCRQVEIQEKTKDIADRVSHIDIDNSLQYIIKRIMYPCRYSPNKDKA